MEASASAEKPRRTRRRRKPADKPADAKPVVTAEIDPNSGFIPLGLSDDLLRTLASIKFDKPSDIQRELIPHALKGLDCLGQAKTGTGKTAAFAIPLIERVEPGGGMQALVLVPTRELALQVGEHVKMLSAAHPLRTLLAYGGTRVSTQLTALNANPPEILVGTPGRVMDLMSRGALKFDDLRLAVLDEVDRMLDIGFRDDIRKILKAIRREHQTIFVSATINDEIRKLAKTFMREPVEINVSADRLTVDDIEQDYVSVDPRDKYRTLLGFLRIENPKLAIVFTRTKHSARRVAEKLQKDGVKCLEIHGDLMQRKREQVLQAFRSGRIQALIATDLASRGLDVMEVSHIVNYDIPEEASVYVHRVGRTARMGAQGYAVTFVAREDGKYLTEIEMLINRQLKRLDAEWVVTRAPEADPEKAAKPLPPRRAEEVVNRDAAIESQGIQARKRTLGSRFRSARRRR